MHRAVWTWYRYRSRSRIPGPLRSKRGRYVRHRCSKSGPLWTRKLEKAYPLCVREKLWITIYTGPLWERNILWILCVKHFDGAFLWKFSSRMRLLSKFLKKYIQDSPCPPLPTQTLDNCFLFFKLCNSTHHAVIMSYVHLLCHHWYICKWLLGSKLLKFFSSEISWF